MTVKMTKGNLTFILQLVCTLLFVCTPVGAQKNDDLFTVRGLVVEKGGKPVDVAYVVFNKSVTVLSDKDGFFQIKNVKRGEYEYQINCLGYSEAKGRFKFLTGKEVLRIELQPLALALDEVTVVAKNAQGSKSKIGQDAIRHIQPKSVADLLQLLPGGLTSNPTLNKLNNRFKENKA